MTSIRRQKNASTMRTMRPAIKATLLAFGVIAASSALSNSAFAAGYDGPCCCNDGTFLGTVAHPSVCTTDCAPYGGRQWFDAGDATNCNPVASPPSAGVCGTAHGVPVSSAPSSNLCSSGTATAVTGAGPWSWSCQGAPVSLPIDVLWTAGACPGGYTDTNLLDDGDNSEHHIGEEDVDGGVTRLCLRVNSPSVTLTSSWVQTSAGCGSVGMQTTTVLDDEGNYGSDGYHNHQMNEEDYRPNGSNYWTWCLGKSGPAAADVNLSIRWPMGGNTTPSCAADEVLVISGRDGRRNLNSEDRNGNRQEAMCIKMTTSPSASNAYCSAPAVGAMVNGVCASLPGSHAAQPATDTATGCVAGDYMDVVDDGSNFNWQCLGQNGGATVNCSATIYSPPPSCTPSPPAGDYCLVQSVSLAAEGCPQVGCSDIATKVAVITNQTQVEYWQSNVGAYCTGTCGAFPIDARVNSDIAGLEPCNPPPPCP